MPAPGVQYPNISRPLWDDGDEITCSVAGASGTVLNGSRFVKIAGQTTDGTPLVAVCTAGTDTPFGVSAHDAAALVDGDAGGHVTVWHSKSKVVEVKAGAALTAGQKVMSDGTGQAIPWVGAGNISAGIAVFDCASGAQAAIDRETGANLIHG